MYIYLNGDFVLENEAKISPFDHGFLYGLGVFETFRIYDGHPFLLDDHFHRLKRSVNELNIVLKLTKQELQTIIAQLLALNGFKDAYVRFNVSAGKAPVGLRTDPYKDPTIIIFIKPINGPFAQSKKAVLLETRRNTPEGNGRLKSHHYLNNIIGKRELKDPDSEGIFLTEDNYVAEGVVSNIFWVKDGQIYTPSIKTGILNGITRQFVIALAQKYDIPVREGFYTEQALFEADEVFVTNSIQEIVSITMLNGHVYNQENNFTEKVHGLYKSYVKSQISAIRQLRKDV